MTDTAPPRADHLTRFSSTRQPEKTGRPREAKDRLTRKFLTALADDFEKHGVEAIQKLRDTDVAQYIRAVGQVVPKEIEITRPLDGMSDGELTAAIQALAEAVRGQVAPQKPEEQPQPTVN